MGNGNVQPHSVMDLFAGTARRDKGVHMLESIIKKAEIPPQLWRTFVRQGTEKAFWMKASFSIESEHYMGGADQPVFMHRVELNTFSIFENFGTTDK